MSENRTPAERIARYKEERRRQLAAQFGIQNDSLASPKRRSRDGHSSSSSEGPRPTRASRLRAAAAAQDSNNAAASHSPRSDFLERSSSSYSSQSSRITPNARQERDKSSKRKSNLNRNLASEEVPQADIDETRLQRRRRRGLLPSALQHSKGSLSNDEKIRSDNSFTASIISPSSSPITASNSNIRNNPRKSDLSVHMENARRGVTIPYSEMGKLRSSPQKKALNSNVKDKHIPKLPISSISDKEVATKTKTANKENIVNEKKNNSESCSEISKRMDELAAFARESLARVEALTNRTKASAKLDVSTTRLQKTVASSRPSSILKKKSFEDITVETTTTTTTTCQNSSAPVSILKRKVPLEEQTTSSNIPPVTFSPSVVEPTTTNRKQGILKKRRSLDESQVLRHRSCSPDVAKDLKGSILKSQRRSSLEEITRIQSPDSHIHGILKRKSLRNEEDLDNSLNSPQGILKRRSGASSAGSSSTTSHVSITTAVILAAAGGAEMILDSSPAETVKPILKKKSFSEEHPGTESFGHETPKPILKKKSSTDTDDSEERPKKPILKMPRHSLDSMEEVKNLRLFYHQSSTDSSCEREVKPILKQNSLKLTFSEDEHACDTVLRNRNGRRPNTICTDFTSTALTVEKTEDADLRRPRPLSVSELVMTFEKTPISTGAVPKKVNIKRNSERYRTQPVTSNELEASLNFVKNANSEDFQTPFLLSTKENNSSVVELTSSTENGSILSSFKSSTSPDSGFCYKMSSDSAFQSLGDGLELDHEEKPKLKPEPSKLELQMKAIAEEAKKRRLAKGPSEVQKYSRRGSEKNASSRFMTQPVTMDEVQEAAKLKDDLSDGEKDEPEPSNLSLSERIKMFNTKMSEQRLQKRDSVVTRRRYSRFQTQPVTSEEVESAKCISPPPLADDEDKSHAREKRGILKSRRDFNSPPKSALKKFESDAGSYKPRSILKPEPSDFPYDEGISSESASDSEFGGGDSLGVKRLPSVLNSDKIICDMSVNKSDRHSVLSSTDDGTNTSDGDSSGGREVMSIIGREIAAKKRDKQTYDNSLWKSKSQSAFGNNNFLSSGIQRSYTQGAMAIAELQARLQKSGESEWKKRQPKLNNASEELKNLYNEKQNANKKTVEAKKDALDASSQSWRNRVEKKDAEQFTVVGRMQEKSIPSINIPTPDKNKRTPQQRKFVSKSGNNASSTPVSPEANVNSTLNRSFSMPVEKQEHLSELSPKLGKKVAVIKPDDDTFKNFFVSVDQNRSREKIDVSVDDLDSVTRESQTLLVQRRKVQVQKRRVASKNPIKSLANHVSIQEEYTEVITGAVEREERRLNIEKLKKGSSLAVEALAGLASNEDFTAVNLKKSSGSSHFLPYKDIMLLQVKGRHHVQTRLVEPTAASINKGDNFILITRSAIYNYVGDFSNVIERSRAADIANFVLQKRDMGCKASKVLFVNGRDPHTTEADIRQFWELLGAEKASTDDITNAGHPDEDVSYESQIINSNMVYEVQNDELVPVEKYWGAIPKVEMLEESNVYVFDFGSEMYVWSGKTADIELKKKALKLAQELWNEGFNYSETQFCPITVAAVLGSRKEEMKLRSDTRPEWAILAKVTQHAETILFKEKFLDWPDDSRLIKVKSDKVNEKSVDASYDIRPCNAQEMFDKPRTEPDLVIEGTHLGRGNNYFDEETNRLFEYTTIEVIAWRILESTYEEMDKISLGQFYSGESYIIRWRFRMTVRGRELSGKPSKHLQSGRDRTIYFFWQGKDASRNEKGAAALLTVELDSENAPQIRVTQGSEPPVFLRLFKGAMTVFTGKRDQEKETTNKLFIVNGEIEDEVSITEVPCSMRQLRSRSSFILISENVVIWHGCQASTITRRMARKAAKRIVREKPCELVLDRDREISFDENEEGLESEEFKNVMGRKQQLYMSLLKSKESYDYSPRLFQFSSVSGTFEVTEIECCLRSKYVTPYPFQQAVLYSSHQPALFMLDNNHELWLWQGWWPEREEDTDLADQTGSGAVRWQAERRAAIQTAVKYWKCRHKNWDKPIPAYLVWAGLEPLEFTNLFPTWEEKDNVAELNIKEGRKAGDAIPVEKELAILTRTTYPLAELIERPLPEGVDPTHLEMYLSDEDFLSSFEMTKEEFNKLPIWKQTDLKKEKSLF